MNNIIKPHYARAWVGLLELVLNCTDIAGGTGTAGTAMAVPVTEGKKMASHVDFHRSFTQTSKVVTIR